MGLFDIFKDKDDDEGGMAEHENEDNTSRFSSEPEPSDGYTENQDETSSIDSGEPTSYAQPTTDVGSQLGIQELMNKRFKLEEAIDYVGIMINNLKGKHFISFSIISISCYIYSYFLELLKRFDLFFIFIDFFIINR